MLPPMYTAEEAAKCLEIFRPISYDEVIEIDENIHVRFNDAGHMLGSSIIEVWVNEDGKQIKTVFSGDIGNNDIPLLSEPTMIDSADFVVMESTYGNRLHIRNDKKAEEFLKIVSETINQGGTVVIPSFAVGRTQEILYELNNLKDVKHDEEFEKEYTLFIYNDETDEVIEVDFVLSEEEEIPEVPKFDDVIYPSWYTGFLEYCVSQGLVSGIGNNRFGPTQQVTRAQVAQTLYAMNGKPQVTTKGNFTDVPDGKWFSDAINWAAEENIMAGYVTGQFQPNAAITRQQFMATLYKYARMKRYDSTRNGNIETYEDVKSITEYAIPAMQWAVGHGVMTGNDKNRLMPKETTTREQMVAILASFDRNVVKKA